MNKVYFSIILCLCITLTTSAQSRKRKTAARKTVKKEVKQEPVEESPAAMLYASMLPSTAKIMFVDSIVVPKDSFLAKIPLNKESGYIADYRQLFPHADAPQVLSSAYINEFGDQIYFSIGNTLKARNLYKMDLLGDKWGPKTPVEGIDTIYKEVNFPFMMSDGITLFFAAKGEESVGGYDIFTTLFDSETGKFFQPENYGLPFNSPANDYLLAIDEMDNVGWLVSDRYQPKGMVCIYTFEPTKPRRSFESDNLEESQIASYARIDKIADTWKFGNRTQVIQRLMDMKERAMRDNNPENISFVVNDRVIYTNINEFKSKETRQQFLTLNGIKASFKKKCSTLEAQREAYAKASQTEKNKMKEAILRMENEVNEMRTTLRKAEKDLRNKECTLVKQK